MKYISHLLAALLVFFGTAICSILVAEEASLIPISTEDYPPYEMKDSPQGLKGFDYELASEIFSEMGFEPDITFLPWERALRHAKTGTSVGILTCAYIKQREEFILYSDAISNYTDGFITLKNFTGPELKTLEAAKGKSVASIKNYASLQALKDLNIEAVEAPTTEHALKMLQYKRFDYLYVNLEAAMFKAKELGITDQLSVTPINQLNFYFCFSKKWPDIEKLAEQFNAILQQKKADGSYDKIHSKYH